MLIPFEQVLAYDVRVIVAGSRKFTDYTRFCKMIDKLILRYQHEKLLFISGVATGGPDKMIINYCKMYGNDYVEVPADWDNITAKVLKIKVNANGQKYNALAGFARNQKMAEIGTHLLCYWDGISPGTADMITRSETNGLTVGVLYF